MSVDFSEHVYYDETSPSCLRWKNDVMYGRRRNIVKFHKDSPAGSISRGYWQFKLLGVTYRSHRIIWKILKGSIDKEMQIDHIDGNALNNKIDNLRLVTNKINQRNKKRQSNNKTGVVGVTIVGNRYRAQYVDQTGKTITKQFNMRILGKEKAFELACKFRLENIRTMVELGEGYTERHILGTNNT